MTISNISILQCFLSVWLITIFVKCIFEIFDKEPPSGLFFGLMLIFIGFFWFLNLKNVTTLNQWISGFYVSGIIGIILISGGIRILLKPPIRSWVAGSIILILIASLSAYSPSQKNKTSLFDFLNTSSLHSFWEQGWFADSQIDRMNLNKVQFFGLAREKDLSLLSNQGNIFISSENIDQQFGLKGSFELKENGKNSYEIESKLDNNLEVVINPSLKKMVLKINIGNLEGVIKTKIEVVDFSTKTGNIQLSINQSINQVVLGSKMGNIILNLYEPVENIEISSNIGNIEIHARKGILLDISKIESNIGSTDVSQDLDQSKGICRIKVKTDVGNITIMNDL